jgi:hypothetical protein
MNQLPSFDAYYKSDPNDNGLNDAAMLTFSKDKLNGLIKELTQNSIDAITQRGTKLKIKVRLESINKNCIPNIEQLDNILDNLISYESWAAQKDFIKFFENSKKILKSNDLYMFSFEDYNTLGLIGNRSKGSFNKLLFAEGSSEKSHKNSLGGFGIGKNAFFGYSGLRTVFYSSLNLEGHKFMGVTKLAEYKDDLGKKKSNRIYYGLWNKEEDVNEISHISNEDQIPAFFRRKEFGLSSYAIGVEKSDDWKDHAKQALIRNYWLLLETDMLEAEIGGDVLDKSNYYEEAIKTFKDDKSILSYIDTFREPHIEITEDIAYINKINIKLREAESQDEYPNKIVFIRDGMMIKEYSPGIGGLPNNISGIILCNNNEGNEILSHMEPPAHNDFLPSLLNEKCELTEKDGKLILKQIDDAKKKAVKLIKEKYNTPTTNVAIIDELLSGLTGAETKNNGTGKTKTNELESFNKIKPDKDYIVQIISNVKIAKVLNEDPTGTIVPKEATKIPATTPVKFPIITPPEIPQPPVPRRPKLKTNNQIKASLYFSNAIDRHNMYKMVVYTNKDIKNTSLSFTQYGDSGGGTMTSELISVKDSVGDYKFKQIKGGYVIEGINLKKDIRNVFDIEFNEKEPSAFKFLN